MNRLAFIVFLGFYLAGCSSVPSSRPDTMVPANAMTVSDDLVDMANHNQVRSQCYSSCLSARVFLIVTVG
jgi:starvation-inducible outer membrane lipoprotein